VLVAQTLLQILGVAAVIVVVYFVSRLWVRQGTPPVKQPEPLGPHATFDGGARYATADERLSVEHDGPGGAGEGILLAIVDALRARGIETNPVEPETYGFMTVVELDGEDVVMQLAAGGEREWVLFVKSPSGRVPAEIMNALRSLEDVRNVTWSV
jgi:hypothetical protein